MSGVGKKRRSESVDPPVKKENVPEFNGTVFKAMLKDPSTAMKGLRTFTSTAKKLPSPDLYDVVEGYVKISMECAEIFALLEGEKQTESELLLIFESLEAILLRTASDLSHFKMVGITIVKKITSKHMKRVQSSFHSADHRFVRQCLSLLSASVSQGPEAAREVLSNIYINKSLSGLAKRKDKRGKPDVRLAFTQFVLSFLVTGDIATVGHILETIELLPEILSTGLKEDRMSSVSLILSTLKTRVVMNKGVSKTQKVRFFTPAVLANIASLYKWNGIVDATMDDDKMENDSKATGVSIIRDLVHSFFLELCCSRKNGISFHDASLGTAGRGGNIVLLQFLVGLKQATDDELLSELVVNILKTSPDILSRYFKETQHSYLPRLKSAWQDNVKLLKKIYEAQPDISTVFQGREVIPVPRLLSMILVLSLPPVCSKAFFSSALGLSNTSAQLTTLSILNFILKKANKALEYLLDKSAWCSSDVYSGDVMEELAQEYRETLSKILPDMTSIVGKWQQLSKKDKTDDEEKKTKTEETAEQKEPGVETAEVILLKALILQVICMYQKVVPHLVSQCKFDFSKLLKGIVSEKGMKEGVPPVLQHHLLQLALDLPANKFSWFRIQDVADKDSLGEKSVLYLLLKMFVSSSSGHLKTSTQKLVVKVLKDSGVFEHTWTELELWLNQLIRLHPDQQETVIQFLEKVLGKLMSNSHVYTDKVASLVQDAGYLQANLSNQDSDAASIPVSHIDDVLDMLDVIMEGNDGEMEEFGPSLNEELIIQTFPFSVVVPAALEARNKLPADKDAVFGYLSAVLSDVLHCQRDPLPLCLALLQYDKELSASELPAPLHPSVIQLHQYYSIWIPEQSREELFKSSESSAVTLFTPTSYAVLMKSAYIQGSDDFLRDSLRKKVEESLSSMSLTEFPIAIKQILLYIKATVENFGTLSKDAGATRLKILMETLQDLVTRLKDLKETGNAESATGDGEQSDLFLELNQSSTGEESKEQILVSALGSILKHPCLQQWFLALESSELPPHSLNPVRLKSLCALMTDGILTLLKIISPTLHHLSRLDLLESYTTAIEKAAVKELTEIAPQPAKAHSRAFQALLSLHSYMDSSSLREVVSKLLLLPQSSLISLSTNKTQSELSIYGQAALQILTESQSSQDSFLTQAHLLGLGTLLLSCSSPALEAFLLQTLTREAGSAKLIHTDVLLHCLQQPLPNRLAIAATLLQNCSAHRLCFERWSLQTVNLKRLAEETDAFITIINTYLQMAAREDPARPAEVKKEVLKALKKTLLAKLSQRVLGTLPEDSAAQLTETLTALIKLSSDVEDIQDLISNLPLTLQNVDTFERWKLVDVISEKLAGCPEELQTWRRSVVAAALKCLVTSYSQSKDQTASPSEDEHSVLKKLQQLLTSADDISASEWNSFVKNGLKYRYRDPHLLQTLNSLLEIMYVGGEVQKDLIPLSTLHMMSSSHSMFLRTMLESEDETTTSEAKEELVALLLSLVKKCPSVCNINHFVVLLGAYGATLSTADQNMLRLLQEYEKNQISLLKFQSFMWGPAAVEHHKTRKSLGASLWKQASSDDILALLKSDRMLQTVAHFPQQRRIFPQDDMEHQPYHNTVKEPENLYDPCFLLPLFSAILQPESVVDCLKFVSSHALGVTVSALSSNDPKVRAAGCHVLSCFYHHLDGARFRERKQLLYLMDMVKNGIRKPNQRLPFVLTTYVAKVAQLMLKPEDHMYVVLNRFLLSHQSLDFRRVPEFFKLFYGFDLEHKMEREWILSVLEEGISDSQSYALCNQQGIFQVLLAFSSNPLCDDHFQTLIIKVLCKASKVTKAAYNLIKSSGLLPWMIQVIEKRSVDQQLLCGVIELLHVVWFTNLGQKEKQAERNEEGKLQKCLSPPLIAEFLSVASAISRQLRLSVKAAQLRLFLQTFSSVLKHRATVLRVNKQAGRFTLHPQPLSCTEVLSLLLCWASLAHNTPLLNQIHAMAEKHKLKELTGVGKAKLRGRGSQARKQNLADDSDSEKEDEILLKECQFHLGSIFVHWEPVIHLTEAAPNQPRDKLDSIQLASDTAHLLTKWSLRCLLERSHQEKTAKEFLSWLGNSVVKHEEIVNVLLLDGGLKADLLRLYHQAFEAQSDATATAETLRLWTDIMIGLLEKQGGLPEIHHSVVAACRPEGEQDPSTLEAGQFLLSLYIYELWSGTASPQMFLLHVESVMKTKKDKKTSPAAVKTICNDIVKVKK